MKANENKMKDFHKAVKASEKNKVLMWRNALFFACFHVFIWLIENFTMAQSACRIGVLRRKIVAV